MPTPVAETGWVTQRSGRTGQWPQWYMWWWPWAAILYHRDWTLSLGVHVQAFSKPRGIEPFRYGPYIDFHGPMLMVSIGRNPAFVGSLETQRAYAKGKFPAGPILPPAVEQSHPCACGAKGKFV